MTQLERSENSINFVHLSVLKEFDDEAPNDDPVRGYLVGLHNLL
jgi:hypothetical protein